MKTTQRTHSFCAAVAIIFCVAYSVEAQHGYIYGTSWLGGTGNWHDPSKWTTGVPDGDELAEVANGEATFSSQAQVHRLAVGPSGPVNEMGSVVGTADLIIGVIGEVGTSDGNGTGTIERGTGKINLSGADLRVVGGLVFPPDPTRGNAASLAVGSASGTGTNTNFSAVGEVEVNDGDIVVPLAITVGSAGGTGTITIMNSRGTANLTAGNLTTQRLFIGRASGTGTATGTAIGEMTVTGGSILLEDSPLDAGDPNGHETFLRVGVASGTGGFRGNATGTLRVSQGNIVAQSVTVGKTQPTSQASGASQGSLYLENGDLTMRQMELGISSDNGGPAIGLFYHISGTTRGESLVQGLSGKIVLGIGGPTAGEDYSQILVDNITLDGAFEARFVGGYLPKPGDVFDLAVAESITGNYDFQITGINTADM